MPRKPKREKQTITVVVNNTPVTVILHPPTATRKSWYAYWNGLVTSRSTGQQRLEDAILMVDNMVRNGGKQPKLIDAVLSDDEFEAIQRAYFAKRDDEDGRRRAEKTMKTCLEAITAFKKITGLSRIACATADDCAAFQRKARSQPKNWRQQHPKSEKHVRCISANTVLKWSRSLQAAFERVNKRAGKKCVRGVIGESQLLTENPWNQFDWAVDEVKKEVRQLSAEELLSFFDYLEENWSEITSAVCLGKLYLWSACRQEEATSLTWAAERCVNGEHHFRVVGKWGVERWFRIPDGLYRELQAIRRSESHVFAAYSDQLRQLHGRQGRSDRAAKVSDRFKPQCLGDWFYDRLADWSTGQPGGHVSPHVFRKTSLQFARIGEDVNLRVAQDARLSPSVLKAHYIKEEDEQLRQKSNRTYERILAGLPKDVARRCSYMEAGSGLEGQLAAAVASKDWSLAAALSGKLAGQRLPTSG